jgi:hypothetical protein
MFRKSIQQPPAIRPMMIRVREEADKDRMNTVWVNAHAINYIRDQPPDARATIYFRDGAQLDVLESANALVRAINAAEPD